MRQLGAGAVTRGAVIAAAGVAFSADWNDGFGNPTFKTVDGENVDYDAATDRFFAEYLNGTGSQTGACTDPVKTGDQVLFAYAKFDNKVLALQPPTPGEGRSRVRRVTLTVVRRHRPGGRRDRCRQGLAARTGRSPSVRSRAATTISRRRWTTRSAPTACGVCVTDGADGACGTTVPNTPGTPRAAATAGPRRADGHAGRPA